MSEFDVDVRAVSGASYGARIAASDINQTATASQPTAIPQSDDSHATTAGATAGQPPFRYDSFRFVYQTDYGRIVLVDQDPQTGKAVSQIPSQRALQLYAEQNRADVRAEISVANNGAGSSADGGLRGSAGTAVTATHSSGSGDGGRGTAGPKSPDVAAVSVPSPAYLTQAFPPVNITI